jgi:hypothetical protein
VQRPTQLVRLRICKLGRAHFFHSAVHPGMCLQFSRTEHAPTGGGFPRYTGIVGTLPALLAEKQQKFVVISKGGWRDENCVKMPQLCALTMAAAFGRMCAPGPQILVPWPHIPKSTSLKSETASTFWCFSGSNGFPRFPQLSRRRFRCSVARQNLSITILLRRQPQGHVISLASLAVDILSCSAYLLQSIMYLLHTKSARTFNRFASR